MDGDRHITGRTLAKQLGDWRASGSGVAYVELADRIKLLMLDGRLPTRSRLPAERELAAALRVSRTTVAASYDLLRQTGYLQSRRGSGSWTTLPEGADNTDLSPFAPTGDGSALDLAYAAPPAPSDAMAKAMAWATDRIACFARGSGYQLLGLDGLRDVVAERFTQRGLPTARDQVLITCGAQQAFALVLSALLNPGDRVLVEHPTYPNALDAIAREHARAVPVGFVGPDWDLDTMAAAVRDACPRLIYLIPDYQNPTGRCMNAAQRVEIVELCRRTRTPLVIDETMSEIALDGPPPAPLAAQARDSGSAPLITIGSASKPLWGGLRVGWVRARRPLIERVARARASVDISTSVLDQLVTQYLMANLDEVLAARLPALRGTRDHLLRLVAEHFPGWTVSVPAGGLSLWADLGAPVSSALVTAAGQHGVLLAAGPRFGLDGAFERCIRLPYTLPEPGLAAAMQRLAAAWTSLPATGTPGLGWSLPSAEVA
jgi:DNA-binding transcriptional MocR family regulator